MEAILLAYRSAWTTDDNGACGSTIAARVNKSATLSASAFAIGSHWLGVRGDRARQRFVNLAQVCEGIRRRPGTYYECRGLQGPVRTATVVPKITVGFRRSTDGRGVPEGKRDVQVHYNWNETM